jgi:UDP-N-acetylmuramyl pentapeptide phosphotransferase/UDP-N-acetylglucosamine-1-phosphate transferase
MRLLIAAVMSLATGYAAARLISKQGLRWGLADVPNERSSHKTTVPRGGAIGIPVAAAIVGVFLTPSLLKVIGVSAVIAVLAFISDRREFPVGARLLLEAAAAVVVAYPAIALSWSAAGVIWTGLLLALSMLYVIAQSNFFNFMDGIDGIAAIEAIISYGLLAILGWIEGKADIAILSVAVVAGVVGFLPLNFPRAKVFMGDVGSVFLGFLFAAFVVSLAGSVKEFLTLSLFQGVFSVDCVLTIIRRVWKKDNLFKAHREHLYQRLVHFKGWSHPRASLVFGAAQLVFGTMALLLRKSPVGILIGLWPSLVIAYIVSEVFWFRRALPARLLNNTRSHSF